MPSEIKECISDNENLNIYFGILVVNDSSITKRLKSRNWCYKSINDNLIFGKVLEKSVRLEKKSIVFHSKLKTPKQITNEVILWFNKL